MAIRTVTPVMVTTLTAMRGTDTHHTTLGLTRPPMAMGQPARMRERTTLITLAKGTAIPCFL